MGAGELRGAGCDLRAEATTVLFHMHTRYRWAASEPCSRNVAADGQPRLDNRAWDRGRGGSVTEGRAEEARSSGPARPRPAQRALEGCWSQIQRFVRVYPSLEAGGGRGFGSGQRVRQTMSTTAPTRPGQPRGAPQVRTACPSQGSAPRFALIHRLFALGFLFALRQMHAQ